jgi:hypothetical protein
MILSKIKQYFKIEDKELIKYRNAYKTLSNAGDFAKELICRKEIQTINNIYYNASQRKRYKINLIEVFDSIIKSKKLCINSGFVFAAIMSLTFFTDIPFFITFGLIAGGLILPTVILFSLGAIHLFFKFIITSYRYYAW